MHTEEEVLEDAKNFGISVKFSQRQKGRNRGVDGASKSWWTLSSQRIRILLHYGCRNEIKDSFTSQMPKLRRIEAIISDDDVLNSWEVVTAELEDEALSYELLRHFIELWTTIRGFSAVGAWLEYYKQLIDCGTKGTHALRKGLNRKYKLEDEENKETDSQLDYSYSKS